VQNRSCLWLIVSTCARSWTCNLARLLQFESFMSQLFIACPS